MKTITTTGSEFEYRGLMARLWDAFRGDTTHWVDQVLFRAWALRVGGRVLDVGCGTGRLLLDLMQHGVTIDGVDNSPEMLALCREKAAARGLSPILYQQAMEALDLPQRYRLILVPSSSFQLLCDPEQAALALERLVAHLEPGGELVMPFMTLWQPSDPLETSSTTPREVALPDGTVARRYTTVRFDPTTHCESTEERYELWHEGTLLEQELHQRSPATRSYTQNETVALLAAAGLHDIQLLHEFVQEPARPDDTLFTAVGRRID